MRTSLLVFVAVSTASLAALSFGFGLGCGGSAKPSKTTADSTTTTPATPPTDTGAPPPPPQEAAEAVVPCGTADTVKTHDLNGTTPTEALAPCAATGAKDYSGLIRIENVPGGVRIIVTAKDDEVTLLGPDLQSRDAVIVYPKGAGTQAVEVPLVKTATGYSGDKIILWSDLGSITDDGTKVDVAIFDHDKSSGKPAEQLHVSVAITAGMSCEKASKAFPQHEGAAQPDYAKLQAPMSTTSFDQSIGACNVPSSTGIKLCAEVQGGQVKGVTVNLSPNNNNLAVCIDRVTRALAFPSYGEPAQVKWVSKASK